MTTAPDSTVPREDARYPTPREKPATSLARSGGAGKAAMLEAFAAVTGLKGESPIACRSGKAGFEI